MYIRMYVCKMQGTLVDLPNVDSLLLQDIFKNPMWRDSLQHLVIMVSSYFTNLQNIQLYIGKYGTFTKWVQRV